MTKNNEKGDKYYECEIRGEARKKTCSEMIYDPSDGTIFGRTCKSWGQLFLFYAIFYIILAILFAICMQGLLSSVNDEEPKWKLEESLIGTNPGLGFRPLSEQTERGGVIKFDRKKTLEVKYWMDLAHEFLEPYQRTEGSPMKHCNYKQPHSPNEVCVVDLDSFGPCSLANGYGYNTSAPCIFLKLNKIYSWVPEVYNAPIASMPLDLQQVINSTDVHERNQIWVTCNGHFGKDKEHFQNITYHPSQGFPAFYYPYQNQPGYLSPVVAVQINDPPAGNMLDIECRAWAKNIIYSGSLRDRKGSVTFQIFMD